MAGKCIIFIMLCYSLVITVAGFPVGHTTQNTSLAMLFGDFWVYYVAVAFLLTGIILVFGCLSCCRQRAGFKSPEREQEKINQSEEFRNNTLDNPIGVDLGFVSSLQSGLQRSSAVFDDVIQPESVITFEPLPHVIPHKQTYYRLPLWSKINANSSLSASDWFGGKNVDFSRQQLHYLRECGQGWFGKVVEGEAKGVQSTGNKVCRVFVRILKEDASSMDQALFLYEAKPYRDLSHPNILKLLARCLDNIPFLLIFESCSNGDLKSYLQQNIGNRDTMIPQGTLLRMAIDIAGGLNHMLQNGFVHTDVAARNCLVTCDLRVKVGDYGISIQTYKEDYYCTGDVALPIRWCAPETLKFSNTSIETKQVTGSSCVWSYGVLLWELEEWGKLPYKDLTDDEVIVKVLGEQCVRLQLPSLKTPYSQHIYRIMEDCWKSEVDRPSFIHIINSVTTIFHKFKSHDFEYRWQSMKPNIVSPSSSLDNNVATDNNNLTLSRRDSDSGIDLETFHRRNNDSPSNRNASYSQHHQSYQQQQQQRHNSPISGGSRRTITQQDESASSPSSSRRYSSGSTADLFSTSSLSLKQKSPSLENLHGSLDNLSVNKRSVLSPAYDAGILPSSDDFSLWFKNDDNANVDDSDNNNNNNNNINNDRNALDFQLGPINRHDRRNENDRWTNNQPLFPQDSLQEDGAYSYKRIGVDSLTDQEDEIWRKRIERGEFTEKVKEKSKSVADLMILTHIDYSESSESDSLPSLTRQNSFKQQQQQYLAVRRYSKNAHPSSLFNSLNFGSESTLPVVEKDNEFQDALKKIQVAKINRDEDSLTLFSSLIAKYESFPTAVVGAATTTTTSVNNTGVNNTSSGKLPCSLETSSLKDETIGKHVKMSSPLLCNEFTPHVDSIDRKFSTSIESENFDFKADDNSTNHFLGFSSFRTKSRIAVSPTPFVVRNEQNGVNNNNGNIINNNNNNTNNDNRNLECSFSHHSSSNTQTIDNRNVKNSLKSSEHRKLNFYDDNAVVLGANEDATLEYFKGLKTTLVDFKMYREFDQETVFKDETTSKDAHSSSLNEFLNDTLDDYFYSADGKYRPDVTESIEKITKKLTNEVAESESDETCSCYFKSYDRDFCGGTNVCGLLPSDDSGRGTDQINSVDGNSDKSLEGCISEQMNQVKSRLEAVIANGGGPTTDNSEGSCCSFNDDDYCCNSNCYNEHYERESSLYELAPDLEEAEVINLYDKSRLLSSLENEIGPSRNNLTTENLDMASMESSVETVVSDESLKTVVSPKRELIKGDFVEDERDKQSTETYLQFNIEATMENWQNDFLALFNGHIYCDHNNNNNNNNNKRITGRTRKRCKKSTKCTIINKRRIPRKCNCRRVLTKVDDNVLESEEKMNVIDKDYLETVLENWREEIKNLLYGRSKELINNKTSNRTADIIVESNRDASNIRKKSMNYRRKRFKNMDDVYSCANIVLAEWQRQFKRFFFKSSKTSLNGVDNLCFNHNDFDVASDRSYDELSTNDCNEINSNFYENSALYRQSRSDDINIDISMSGVFGYGPYNLCRFYRLLRKWKIILRNLFDESESSPNRNRRNRKFKYRLKINRTKYSGKKFLKFNKSRSVVDRFKDNVKTTNGDKDDYVRLDSDLLEAIRNELKEKLPKQSRCASSDDLAKSEQIRRDTDEENPEEEEEEERLNMIVEYSKQLSPILEEDEEEQCVSSSSSSSISSFSLSTNDGYQSSLSSGSSSFSYHLDDNKHPDDDNNTISNEHGSISYGHSEWNEALILDNSDDGDFETNDALSSSATITEDSTTITGNRLNETTYNIIDTSADSIRNNNGEGVDNELSVVEGADDMLSDNVENDSLKSYRTDSISGSSSSSKTGAQLSCSSSSESGNLSDVFLSPTLSKNFEEDIIVPFDVTKQPSAELSPITESDHVSGKVNRDEHATMKLTSQYESYPDLCSNIGHLSDCDDDAENREGTTLVLNRSNDNDVNEISRLKAFFSPRYSQVASGSSSLIGFNLVNSPDSTTIETHSLPININFENNDCRWYSREFTSKEDDLTSKASNADEPADIRSTAAWESTVNLINRLNNKENAIANETSMNENSKHSLEPESCSELLNDISSNCNNDRSTNDDLNANENFESSKVLRNRDDSSPRITENNVSCILDTRTNDDDNSSADRLNTGNVFHPFKNDLKVQVMSNSNLVNTLSFATGGINELLNNPNLKDLGIEEIHIHDISPTTSPNVVAMNSWTNIRALSEDKYGLDANELINKNKEVKTLDDGVSNTNANQIENCCNGNCTDYDNGNDCTEDEHDDDDDDDDDDDEEDNTEFTPSSWNSSAKPKKSSLRNKHENKMKCKKNVTFKKQTYHSVYEYPKEEYHFSPYSENLNDHMYNLWNIKNEISYFGDYSMFSDWELEDCEDQSDEDFCTYPNLKEDKSSKKMDFYSFSGCDLDNNSVIAVTDETSPAVPFLESDYGPSIIISDDNGNDSLYVKDEWCDKKSSAAGNSSSYVYDTSGSSASSVSELLPRPDTNDIPYFDETVDDIYFPLNEMGELRHTKDKLKLNLNGNGQSLEEGSEEGEENNKNGLTCESHECECIGNDENNCVLSKNKILPIISLPNSTLSTSMA